jgi:chitinase
MIPAFEALTPENQKLMTENFIVGVSLGGAAAWPIPISKVYTEGKYKDNNTQLFVDDLLSLIPKNKDGTYMFQYFDFDLEHLEEDIDVETFSSFFGGVAEKLKAEPLLPQCLISHAPQTPYFTDKYKNVYTTFYLQYKNVIDFFNIQYYNNGTSNTFEEIFVNSDSTEFPGVAVVQLIQKGISPSAIVVGKPVNAQEGSQGFVPLNPITQNGTLSNDVQQAFATPALAEWASLGGVMIWYYNTQVSLGNGTYLSPYIQVVYNPVSTKDSISDDENILDFFSSISSLS